MINNDIRVALRDRILVLDGAMGTLIQTLNLGEDDFRGDRFKASAFNLKGCYDVLVLTRLDLIENIHRSYMVAGADIIETNTFNANAVSLSDYGLECYVEEINFEAAKIARRVADEFGGWVAGCVGQVSKSLSMSATMENDINDFSFDKLEQAYLEQMRALLRGGVDFLLIETVFDTLNATAALSAATSAMKEAGRVVDIIISATLSEEGRTLNGQSVSDFIASVGGYHPLAIGLNCGFGVQNLSCWLGELAENANCATIFYPNAGLPDEFGMYALSPETMADLLADVMSKGLINIVGGCCGTTPEHISAIAAEAKKYKPRMLIAR